MAGQLLVTGFEHGSTSTAGQGLYASLTASGSSVASVSSAAALQGNYGLRLEPAGAACWARWTTSTSERFTMGQIKFRFNTLPVSGEVTLLGLETAAGTMGQAVYTASDGNVKVRIGSSGVAMTTSITAGTTYRLNLRYDTDGSTWTLDAWLNGTDQTTQTASSMSNSTVDAIRTGATGTPTCSIDVDDVVVLTDTSSPSLPGERQVEGLFPSGDGTHAVGSGAFRDQSASALNNGSTTVFERLNEDPMSGTSDWVEQTAVDASGYLELTLPNTSATTIVGARAIVSYHAGGSAKASVFSSAVESIIHSGSMNVGGTLTFKSVMISPNGGTWDATDIDGLVARIGYASVVATTPKWDGLMVEYAFEPSASVNKNDSDSFALTETQSGTSGGGGGATSVEWGPGGSWGLGFQNCIGVGLDGLVIIGADVAGFHISEDEGQTVIISNNGMGPTGDRALAGILPDHTDPDTIYGAALTGVLKSSDRGLTWTRISTAVTWVGMNDDVPNIGANRPRTTGNVLAWGSVAPSGNRWMYAATVSDGVFRSSNNGVTWTRIWGVSNGTTYPRGMACVSQSSTDDLYVGCFESGNGNGGLYHIDNAGGSSITPTVTKMTTPFVCVEEVCAVVPDNTTRRIYVVGFAGSNASRSHGTWHAQNPGNAASASWVRGPTTQLATTSPWAAVDAYERSGGLGDVVAIGCFSPRSNSGNFEEVFISTDGGENFTCITLNDAKIHGDEVGGPGGPPWNAGSSNYVGNAGHALAGPSQLKFNPDGDRLYASRYAGAWVCVNPVPSTGRNWYPMVNALEVTINQSVIADPNVPGTVYLANIDRGIFASDDNLATFTLRSTGFNASRLMALDTTQTPSHLYVGGGDRDTNVDGDIVHFADAVSSATNTSLQNSSGQTLAGLTGGKRCYGVGVRKISGTVNVLGAVVGHGIVRYRWDGAGTPDDGTWATVKGFPPMANASPGNKGAPFDWQYDDIVVLYDPNSGVWRGKNGTSVGGSTVMTSWTLLFADTSSTQGVGDIRIDPVNKERCFVSSSLGLYRLDNIFSAADSTEVTRSVITKPTSQTPGPIDIDELGRLWVTMRAQLTIPEPGIYRTSTRGSLNPSWADLSDDYYHRGGQWPLDLDVSDDGYVYLAMDGLGSMVGAGISETEVTISDTDSATVSESQAIETSLVAVSNEDVFTLTDAETTGIAGGDAQLTDSDLFVLSETQSHDNETTPGPPIIVPPPLPPVRHVLRSAAGTAYPDVADWSAEEDAPGGYGAATGRMALAELHSAPHLYQPGATWQIWGGSEILWEGILLAPIIDGDTVRLSGRGWGQMADRDVQRVLYLSRNYSDWVPGDSEPFNYRHDAAWDASSDGGRLTFIGRKGDDVADGDQASLVFHAEGSRVTSIAGELKFNNNGGTNQVLRVGAATFPGAVGQAGNDIDLADGATFDRDFSGSDRDLASVKIQRVDGGDTFGQTVRVSVTDLRVRGAATTDEMASSEVALDVFGRLGVEALDVTDTGDDAMPLDAKGGTLGDVLTHASLVSGVPWRIVSTGAARLGTFREGTTWATTTEDGSTTLLPVQRYNRVVVRFQAPNGRTRQVTAEPADIGVADPYASTGAVFSYFLDVDQAHPSTDKMQALAERLLADLILERYTGDLERAWLEGPDGALRHAYAIAAGDRIRIADALGERAVTVTVASKVSTATSVRLTLAAATPELDRYEARSRS